MNWRLGLDLGTNSIGWCALELADNRPINIIDMGVRIFPDGREPAAEGRIGDSLAVQRRMARGMRRRRDRHNRQKRKVFSFFLEKKLIQESEKESIKLINPYLVRKEGLDRKLTPQELTRAFYHLSVRRGFKSNRKDQKSGDKELSTNLEKIRKFNEALEESESRTLGEYLYFQKQKKEPIRFRPENSDFYPERSMYEEEFKRLKEKQREFYPNINWELLYDLIFFQRPLAKQERGKCQFYTDKERAYKALPSSNIFRILQEINNMFFIDEYGQKIGLSYDEKQRLFDKMNNCRTVGFTNIKKLMNSENRLNLENRTDSKLNGNSTAYTLRNKKYLGELWDSLSLPEQDNFVETLIDSETDEKILSLIEQWDLSKEQIQNILNLTFPSGTVNLSKEFMYDCIKYMKDEWLPYHLAVEKMGLHHSDFNNRDELLKSLPYYGELLKGSTIGAKPHLTDKQQEPEKYYGKIGNPTVHIALNQLRKLVNALIIRFGSPSEIVVELSRDLKQSRDSKAEAFKRQKEAKKENDRIREEFKEEGIDHPSAWDIKKFKLWEELGGDSMVRRCVYCGETISRSQLASNEVEIEHILPYSRTLINSMGNLTVSHKRCNQAKGNKTPEEAFGTDQGGFDYSSILERAILCFKEGKYKNFLKGAMEDFDKESGFIDRQLTDNAYLSRKSKEYLSSICPFNKIWTIKGGQTAELRAQWGLNTLLSSSRRNYYKNRSDHRHHSLDALVIGLTDRGMIKKMATLNALGHPEKIKVPHFPFSLQEVETRIRNIKPSIKPDHGKEGKLFQETALGRRQQIERRSLSDFKTIEEIEWIESRKLKARFRELLREEGFNKAKKIMISEWAKDNDSEGPYCRIPTWVTRKDLKSLKGKELGRIWDKDLKRQIYKTIDVENLNDKQLEQELTRFSEKTGIRRVRFIPDNTQNASIIKSVPNKAYLPNDYLYVVVWAIPPHRNKKDWEYKGYFVDRVQANDKKFTVPKPHPAAKNVATLYKNDIIKITDEKGSNHYARIQGFSITVNCIDIQAIYSSKAMMDWHEHTRESITDQFFAPMKGQNFKSINTLWKKYSIRKISITVDGRERIMNNHAAPNCGDFGGRAVPVF